MNAEKMLKKQAKTILARDNWAKSITGFLMVLLVLGIGFIVINIATLFIGSLFTDDGSINFADIGIINIILCLLICVGALAVLILMSPLYTGYIRFIADCRDGDSGDINDIFYYFSKEKYFETVQFNIYLFIKKAVYLLLFSLPVVGLLLLSDNSPYQTALQIGAVWVGGACLFGYFFVSRLYILSEYLYVKDFHYEKESDIAKASKYIVKRNLGKVMGIYVSYLGWLILCFLVIPIVFVYPYFKHTAVLSYSYLYDIENSNPQSPLYQSDKPSEPNPPVSEIQPQETQFSETQAEETQFPEIQPEETQFFETQAEETQFPETQPEETQFPISETEQSDDDN